MKVFHMRNLVISSITMAVFLVSSSVAEEVNNGTNPTLLATTMGIQYQYTNLGDGLYAGLYEAFYTRPFGEKGNMSWTTTLRFASGPIDQDIGLGDFSAKFTHVPIVTPEYGAAYTVELFLDTADRPELGSGQTNVKMSAFYAKFLEDGSIFAPAVVHQFGLGDEDFGRSYLNQTTIDFYYVPKLPDPKYYVTLDPALIRDWENEKNFASLQVTMGMLTGKLFGGESQIFVKPGVLVGGGQSAAWSVQAGFKVIGF